MNVAAGALNFQPFALHGGKMSAACDEGDVGAGLGQRRTETASDATRADNRDTHEIFPLLLELGTTAAQVRINACAHLVKFGRRFQALEADDSVRYPTVLGEITAGTFKQFRRCAGMSGPCRPDCREAMLFSPDP